MKPLRPFPKGRRPRSGDVEAIRTLIRDLPRDPSLLVEYLHCIQDAYGGLSRDHLCALAAVLELPMAQVYETASFYHHFDIYPRNAPRDRVTVRVCTSPSCAMAGGEQLLETLTAQSDPDKLRVVSAPCMGRCHRAPNAAVGQNYLEKAEATDVLDAALNRHTSPRVPTHESLAEYLFARQGYQALERCRQGHCTVSGILDNLDAAGLRGLGGAGFPSNRKWEVVRSGKPPRYLCVNADEGEPGTFKDRHYLTSQPHQFLEGVLIAQWAVAADLVYIYLRDEYPECREILRKEIQLLEDRGIAPAGMLELRRGAGAYICGEESAMIESLEGKRGLPRQRPPFVAEVGLFGRPTLVHNVETLFWISDILRRGGQWFADHGDAEHKGLRSYSVSGRVKNPGVKLAPAGTTARELIETYCGGMAAGHTFAAYLPGGASGGILPADLGDLPLDFGSLEPHGCFVGSHAVVILSQEDDLPALARNLVAFFCHESCGQCTPCRVGCEKLLDLISAENWDLPLIQSLSQTMQDASICGLGQAAPNPVLSILRHFPQAVPAKERP